ncbi:MULTISPECIES: FAD-dependent oxidoreductase [Thalassobaculum]|uniref:2-polyprenyl-6-methoxyphenol hydroxylase n=1 Tax=Thalassobaculum litoreum DSM 18839 TaxID=1123362 RepID=A0A8G2EXX4_9PROT|nr:MULTISPECIES: FAD-dependent monooxygenase [Thalassobaculum]SDF39561.1 2-polyprenyl-6-methoxyphenol hydroxylase [Thalassobaculum litoreum DSM 18839]
MAPSVLVAGAGPVGLAAANRLTRNGATVRIVDSNAARTTLSKALAVNVRTMELLERSGLTERLIAAGQRLNRMRFFSGAKPLADIHFDRLDHRYNFLISLPQSETERILEEDLLALGVGVDRRTGLTAFSAGDDVVDATLRSEDGSETKVRVDYLIGADGAHSMVRKGLGVGFPGERHPLHWNLADVEIDGPYGADEVTMHLQPEHAMLVIPLGGRRFRIVTTVPDALSKLPMGKIVGTPSWSADFSTGHRIVDSYGSSRVFLAGDAAHIHSPAGGRGMNLGIEDATVLADRISNGGLTSYSRDRRRVGLSIVQQTERMLSMATLKNPMARGLRNMLLRQVVPLDAVQRILRPRLMGIAD